MRVEYSRPSRSDADFPPDLRDLDTEPAGPGQDAPRAEDEQPEPESRPTVG